jgi:hypothetical protein
VHAVHVVGESSWHSNVEPVFVAVKEKLGLAELLGDAGADVIVVSGGVESIVQVKDAGVGSTFPAASTAATLNVCGPAASPVYGCGLVQVAAAAVSSWHWKVAPLSGDVKANEALVELVVADGDEVMVVSGAVASTVQL